ncbi:MAG: EAL domain-containing protein [Betaproteobacteria bacterium]|nr:EAL domain-containing protein [Betaproteobacteria bacterium]
MQNPDSRIQRIRRAIRQTMHKCPNRSGDSTTPREALYRSVLENLAEGVVILNEACRIETINPAAQRIFGYDAAQASGLPFCRLTDSDIHLRNACDEFRNGAVLSIVGKRANGETFPLKLSASFFSHDGNTLIAFVVQDVSAHKAFEDQLIRMAYYDHLTGLPNRRLFHDRLAQAVAHADRNAKLTAIFFLDLDRFKTVNDTFGHEFGDLLLVSVAERLAGIMRKCDTLARMGGDEFTVLLEINNIQEAEAVAQKITESFAQPFLIGGQELFTSTSIGITVYPLDASDIDTLIKNADTAMYHAKSEGRNNYQLYAKQMNAPAAEKMRMENTLRKAVSRHQLRLHYQPQAIVHCEGSPGHARMEIIGAEALLRWEHPEFGLLPPDRFIPLAEESGLIIPIGEWVLRAACAQNKLWQAAGLNPISIAVNLSPRQLHHPKLAAQIEHLLNVTGHEPTRLEIEITESMMLHGSEKIVGTLRAIKQMGVRIAIDDFGTGHSSLSHLQHLPVDTVKIDRTFIRNITSNPNDAAITQAVIDMARNMGLRIVAEGVETREQMMFLQELHCSVMQGYFFSKPVPSDEFAKLARAELSAYDILGLQ